MMYVGVKFFSVHRYEGDMITVNRLRRADGLLGCMSVKANSVTPTTMHYSRLGYAQF